MSFRLRPKSEDDIAEIATYIASDNPRAARAWVKSIRDTRHRIGRMPGIGAPRSDIAEGLRITPVGNYIVLCLEENGGADILRVIHGARDQANWL